MKIMSVDYGDARTGIAMSDINETLASSYCVIIESYAPKLADRIAEIAKKEKPGKIIIGLPRNMDGTYGFRCEKCRQLGDLLSELCDAEIDYATCVDKHGKRYNIKLDEILPLEEADDFEK